MYRAYCDNALMYDSRIEELALINPVVNLEENKAGSFSFTINPVHPFYDKIQKRKSIIEVYQDADLLFSGMCIDEGEDFYKQKNIYCEGELSYLNDSVQRPARYQNITVRGLLEAYIANHNSQVEAAKRFTVGMVTVTDPNDYIYCYTNMESTMQALKEDLVDDLGGFFRTRHENGVKYIDYLADSPNTNSQVIKIGKNLMDFASNVDSTDIATAIIPLGVKLEESTVEGLETRLTIESVNGGLDYVYSQEAVDTYGWIYKSVTWDDVTTPEALKRKGEQYLADIQFENMVIEAKAVDLHLTDKDIERFKLSDQIQVLSAPHGLDRYFRLTKLSINLNNPAGNTITLGKDEKVTLSARSNQASEEIKKAIESIVPSSDILKQAAENATNLIATAMGGYIVKTENELLIMDTNSTETATKVWRWNINGLGYSKNGYKGPYELAMTMDGSIVADFIKTGSLNANLLKSGTLQDSKAQNYWNLATGEFSLAATTKVGSSTIATAKNVSDAKASANSYADNAASTAQSNANKYADTAAQNAESNANTYANGVANNAESNAKTYASGVANTAQTNANKYADGVAQTAEKNANTYASNVASNAESNAKTHANSVASTAEKNANEYADGLVQDFDDSLDYEEVFNRLTDNGNIKGIILSNGQLFINADYINSGTISGDLIKGGTISASNINSTASETNIQVDISNGRIRAYNPTTENQLIIGSGAIQMLQDSNYILMTAIDSYGETVFNIYDTASELVAKISPYGNVLRDLRVTGDYLTASCDFTCSGTKSRVATTENFNNRLLYCYEMPTPFFGDIGEAQLDETGICYIYIDDIFGETIDTECMYQVFLQKYGEGDCYIAERARNYFVVKGTPNLAFAWEIKAKQAGYTMERLEEYTQEEKESEINYEAEASAYLSEYERKVLNYE